MVAPGRGSVGLFGEGQPLMSPSIRAIVPTYTVPASVSRYTPNVFRNAMPGCDS